MFRRQRQEQIDRRADRRVARVVEDGLRRAGQPIDGPLQVEQHDTVGDAVHHRVQPALAVARLGLAAVVHPLRLDQQRIHPPLDGRQGADTQLELALAAVHRATDRQARLRLRPRQCPPQSLADPVARPRRPQPIGNRLSEQLDPGAADQALESRIHLQHAQVGADQGQRFPQRVQHALAERRSWRLQAFLPRAVPCHYLDQVIAERCELRLEDDIAIRVSPAQTAAQRLARRCRLVQPVQPGTQMPRRQHRTQALSDMIVQPGAHGLGRTVARPDQAPVDVEHEQAGF
jgi:hypothetical protein